MVATYFYVTESDVALERVYFADYTTSGYPQVNTLNLARGASLVTDYGVCVAPEKTTVDRTEKYVSNAASLQVSSFQGLLSVEAGEYGVFPGDRYGGQPERRPHGQRLHRCIRP